jgi:phospholipase C
LLFILAGAAIDALGATTTLIPPPKDQNCWFLPNTLPRRWQKPGGRDTTNPIQHIVVIMQENHSFDSYFGRLNQDQFYGANIDGLQPTFSNPTSSGPLSVFHQTTACLADVDHSWNAAHHDWDFGKNDGFARTAGRAAMGYFDQTQIPYYYGLANQFATADRYFCDVLGPTFPNRDFLYAGTAFGHIGNDFTETFYQKTVFDLMDQYGISWKYYVGGGTAGYLKRFYSVYHNDNYVKIQTLASFKTDLAANTLPEVVFMDSDPETGQDEHPSADIQYGQAWVSSMISALMHSSAWKTSAVFFAYDENGGYFDHVPPPAACVPDSIKPVLSSTSVPGAYDRYGFRVPFVLVSPYAKRHYVSHNTYSHSSILKYIENKFNLPSLSYRDANSDGMTDLFDYANPDFSIPTLPAAPIPTTTCTTT